MRTEKINVKSSGSGLDEVLALCGRYADENGFGRKESLHLRLLSEELLEMVHFIAHDFDSSFWIEGTSEEYTIHLTADTEMDQVKRRELLSASSSGRNMAAKGLMGKVRELIEVGMENRDGAGKTKMQYGVSPVSYGLMGVNNEMMNRAVMSWSLKQYRDSISEAKNETEEITEAWDELEKSIVANIVDDIQVGIMNDKVEIIATKRLSS